LLFFVKLTINFLLILPALRFSVGFYCQRLIHPVLIHDIAITTTTVTTTVLQLLFVAQVSTHRRPSGIVWWSSDLYWGTSLHRTSNEGMIYSHTMQSVIS